MSGSQFSFSLLSFFICSTFSLIATANPIPPTQMDFGGVGLIQMPTGRSGDDGAFSVGSTINEDYYHYFASLQLMPWLESTVRYTRVPDKLYSSYPSFSGDNIYTDKGIDVKVRLLEESFWLPETAIGLRDLGGTGLFDGEFIAMSKRFGSFDTTLGIGWGYIGNRANFMGEKASSKDCGRDTGYQGRGGGFDYSRWFTGCSSVYAGVEYQTPFEPLILKAEYDGNDYQGDFKKGIQPDSPYNFGLIYRLGQVATLNANFERGNRWTLGFTLNTNFNTLKQTWLDEDKPIPTTKQGESLNWETINDRLKTNAGYQKSQIYLTEHEITVVASQSKYRNRQIAHEKVAKILASTGLDVDQYSIIEQQKNQHITQTSIDPKAYKVHADQEKIGTQFANTKSTLNPKPPRGHLVADASKNWTLGVYPVLQQSIGGSEDFYMFNVGIGAGASYNLTDNLEISGSAYLNIYDTYDKFLYEVPPDGTSVMRVRTLVRQYINDNPVRLNNLQLTQFNQFGENVYTQVYGGYLENMFAGVGGEILYRPLASNWAFGLDLNYVIQRDPDSELGIFTHAKHYDALGRPYRVQTGAPTGHLSVYYRPEWSWFEDLTFQVSAGQYLAEDKGVTVSGSKQFDSGVVVGAFLAKTNLSAEEFGEGSFNKGFYISIPFDLISVKPTTSRIGISWVPLLRDGGQALQRKYQLYPMTQARDPKMEKAH